MFRIGLRQLFSSSLFSISGFSVFFILALMIISSPVKSTAQDYFWWIDSSRTGLKDLHDPILSGDGKMVVGTRDNNSANTYMLCRWDAQHGLTVVDSVAPNLYEIKGVSAHGDVIVGNARGDGGTNGAYDYAVKWSAAGGLESLPWVCSGGTSLGNDCSYLAYAVDSNGDVGGQGTVDNIVFVRPWMCVNGTLQYLESADTIDSGVEGLSPDGSTAVGWTDGYRGRVSTSAPALWVGGALTVLDASAAVERGDAYATSNGGSVILGTITDTLYNDYKFIASASGGFRLLGSNEYPLAVSADGSRIFGYDSTAAVVWDYGAATGRSLVDLCQDDYGMDLTGIDLGGIMGMSNDGMAFMGDGSNAAGYFGTYVLKLTRAVSVRAPRKDTILVQGTKDTIRWRCPKDLDLVNVAVNFNDGATKVPLASNYAARPSFFVWDVPDSQSNKCRIYITSVGDSLAGKSDLFTVGKDTFIVVTSPKLNDRWIAGDKDTIRWKSRNEQFVNISFSVNDGVDWWLIGWKVPADTSLFVWTVPDSLSTLCRIMIQSWTDTVKGVSDRFKVKGYVMTRFDATGQYEPFQQGIHDWQFGNQDKYMWPRKWWQQFNYRGTDPATGQPYPKEEPFLSADSSSFPDWPLLVRTFGTTTCYWSVSPAVSYKEKAKLFWKGEKSTWDGSCAGMALGSLLAFDRKDEFRSNFTLLLDFVKLHDLTCTDSVRLVINELWTAWNGTTHQQYVDTKYLFTPTRTLHDIQSMLLSTNQDGQYLYLANNGKGGGAHAIVAYGVKADTVHPGHYFVSVYDNSYPDDYSAKIDIDTTANSGKGSWTYSNWAGWGGPEKLYLMDPSSAYLVPPVLPRTTPLKNRLSTPASIGNEPGRMTVFVSNSTKAIINDMSGKRIGYDTTGELSEIPDAYPIMPPVSAEVPPFGYNLPAGTYTATLTGFPDSVVNISLLGDSAAYAYSRTDAKPGQSDKVEFHGGVSALNADSIGKNIWLEMIMSTDTSEKVIEVADMTMPAGDSLALRTGERSGVFITHRGGAATFDLVLRTASASGTKRFLHEGVTLDGNSSVTVVPVWNDLENGSVKLLIDHGNTGTPNDSTVVTNQALGVNEQRKPIVPTGYALNQNYPNPFNPSTNIEYDVPVESHVRVTVYSILGQEIATLVNSTRQAGRYTIQFPAMNLPAGVYFYKMEAVSANNSAKTFTQTKKMILIK
jgi:hypothetical protein